jgi:hypothetical protein
MIPLRSRSDSWTFTPEPHAIRMESNFSRCPHVSEGEAALAKIAVLVAQGHLDIQTAQELCGIIKIWIDTQYQKDELQFRLNPPETRDTTIRIEGGLPSLPGTNITMPVVNGHAVSEQLLTAPTDVVPPEPPNEFPTPAELKAQGSHPLQEHHFKPDEHNGSGGASVPPVRNARSASSNVSAH